MKKRIRALRFGIVGIISTLIHYISLYSFTGLGASLAPANTAAFLVAITFSFSVQQQVTFRDRLGGDRLNSIALLMIIAVNALICWIGGWILELLSAPVLKFLLPLVGAGTNFILYWLATTTPMLRRGRPGTR